MKFADFVILGRILFALAAALCYIIKKRKNGCSSCCGNCSGCNKCTHYKKEGERDEH
ncbi:MAG: FeoB-associated Cys-rich membrane protein [Acutalibacteraceae bacterium]